MSSPSASRRGTASPNRTSPWSGATSRITSRATPAAPTPPFVEVARSSLAADRALAKTYGEGGIPVYWIVNVVDRQLEVYAHPTDGVYPDPTILGETESVDLILADQVVAQIPVADLLPRKPGARNGPHMRIGGRGGEREAGKAIPDSIPAPRFPRP